MPFNRYAIIGNSNISYCYYSYLLGMSTKVLDCLNLNLCFFVTLCKRHNIEPICACVSSFIDW